MLNFFVTCQQLVLCFIAYHKVSVGED